MITQPMAFKSNLLLGYDLLLRLLFNLAVLLLPVGFPNRKEISIPIFYLPENLHFLFFF